MTRNQVTKQEQWRQLIAEFERSGQKGVRDFCQQHGVGEHSFYMWRRRLADATPVKFALVEPTRSDNAGLEIVLNSGDRVRVCGNTDLASLKMVLAALREGA
jgi:transposase-like protein